jgi:hypothetical protein
VCVCGSEAAIFAKLIALSSLIVLAAGAFIGYSEMQYQRMGEALSADIATYHRQRWDRPVLRGATQEGNAAVAVLTRLAKLRDLGVETRDHLAAQLYYGQPLDPGQQSLIAEHGELIDALQAATYMSWSMTELPVEQGSAVQVPVYGRAMDAALLMLGKAALSEPAQCLQICSDVMRMGQDLVPGAPLEAASVSMRITSVTSPVLEHCAERADLEALARASRELANLASHAPAAGGGIELADLLARVELHKLAELSPPNGSESIVTRLRRRPALFEAFERFGNPTRWRNVGADRYPDAREGWLQEHTSRSRSDLPLVASATLDVDGWLYDDMRGQALLRTMAVGTSTLAERMRRRKLPHEPIGLDEPGLRDPYNGQPLKWRIAQDGSELSVWSVGEDRRDDKGASEWGAQAPLDVVVHFRLHALDPVEGAKRGSRTVTANGHATR